MRPLAIDLFCGLGGWTDGLLAAGWEVIGFDIERHQYGDHAYPAQLVLQDVRTIHGHQLASADLIVASPPCQRYSYMAMPWKRSKALIAWYRDPAHPERLAELNELFDACFRLQREASEAAGRPIPMVVENVRGAQPWVGRARWHYGSYYLWGDVPALMPMTSGKGRNPDGRKIGGDWFSDPTSPMRTSGSKSPKRLCASALIAKIPFELSYHIGRTYLPARAAA